MERGDLADSAPQFWILGVIKIKENLQ